ncbi:hypothetical protein BP6252_12230 [Coleophoma cylindrospora]|uniref:Uncharacterized protein n=1 Tax=Coleophoma cylindrospora TaxID=1849047 RepID=A0A3D8QGH7_9HELO|nr:hypothetical protein BP6252_12230 [Coleophoma cylindrospora]
MSTTMVALPVSPSHMKTGKNGEGIYASAALSCCKDQKTDQGLTLPPKIQSHDSWQYDLSQTVTSDDMDLDSLLAPGQLDMILESIQDDDSWMRAISELDNFQSLETTSRKTSPIKCASPAVAQPKLPLTGLAGNPESVSMALVSKSDADRNQGLLADWHQTAWPHSPPGNEDFQDRSLIDTLKDGIHGESQTSIELPKESSMPYSGTVVSKPENGIQDTPKALEALNPSREVSATHNENSKRHLFRSLPDTTSQEYGQGRCPGMQNEKTGQVSSSIFVNPDIALPSIETDEHLHPSAISNETSSRLVNTVVDGSSTKTCKDSPKLTKATRSIAHDHLDPQQDCLSQSFHQPSLLSLILALDNSSHKSLLTRTILETRQYLATMSENAPPAPGSGLDPRIVDKLNTLAYMFETDKHFQRSTIAWALERMEANNTPSIPALGTPDASTILQKAREYLEENIKDVDSAINLMLKLFYDHLCEQNTLIDGLQSADVRYAEELAKVQERCTQLQVDHDRALRRASVFGTKITSLQTQLEDASKQIKDFEAQLYLADQGGPLSSQNKSFWMCLQQKQDGQTCDTLNPKLKWNSGTKELVQNRRCEECKKEIPWRSRKAIGSFTSSSTPESPPAKGSPKEAHSINDVPSPDKAQIPCNAELLTKSPLQDEEEPSKENRSSNDTHSPKKRGSSKDDESSRDTKRVRTLDLASESSPDMPMLLPVSTSSKPTGQSANLQGHSSGLTSNVHFLESLKDFQRKHQATHIPAMSAAATQANHDIAPCSPLAASATPAPSDQYQSPYSDARNASLGTVQPSAEPEDNPNNHEFYSPMRKAKVLNKLTYVMDNNPNSPGFRKKTWGVWCLAGQEEQTRQRLEAEYVIENKKSAPAVSPSPATAPRRKSQHGARVAHKVTSGEAAQAKALVEVSNSALKQRLGATQRPWMPSAPKESSQRPIEVVDLTTECKDSDETETLSPATPHAYHDPTSRARGLGLVAQREDGMDEDIPQTIAHASVPGHVEPGMSATESGSVTQNVLDSDLKSDEGDSLFGSEYAESMISDEQATEAEQQSEEDELERDLSLAIDEYASTA